MIDKLMGAMIAVVVGVALVPVILTTIDDVRYIDGNISTPAVLPTGVDSLLTILPLLFVIIIVGGAVSYLKYR